MWLVERYTDCPFPAYRFIPGKHPHPTAHPEGHSYGEHPNAVYLPPGQWGDTVDYLYGADLYNNGYWWEAHEAWEGLWQLTDKQAPQGVFLKALIQVSACHLQFLMQQRRGVERLFRTGLAYLGQVSDAGSEAHYMGLDIPRFVEAVNAYYAALELGQAHDPDRYPYVLLRAIPGKPS